MEKIKTKSCTFSLRKAHILPIKFANRETGVVDNVEVSGQDIRFLVLCWPPREAW